MLPSFSWRGILGNDDVNDCDLSLTSVSSTGSSSYEGGTEEPILVLCELVGATQLTTDEEEANLEDLQPFCLVSFGSMVIHKTDPAVETGPNPIWTIDTRSLFLLKAFPSELQNRKLTVQIWSKSKDSIPNIVTTPNIFLGQVSLSAEDVIAHCNEERMEIRIEDERDGWAGGRRGSVALRFRVATHSDIQFLRAVNKLSLNTLDRQAFERLVQEEDDRRPSVPLATEMDEAQMAGASFLNTISSAFVASRVLEEKTGQSKVRVKPFPDPSRPDSTAYMSPYDLKLETRKPSLNWVEAGSGDLGRLYLEILSCHDLPNCDVGESLGNVTDSFVCVVFEDAMVQTSVIDDELSPHWLPWTQRAFCFGIMHPASFLYLGVFDYDLGPMGHEPIGRVAVNIGNLQRDTQYTLKYNLFKSSNLTDRTALGEITIRLRMEMVDEKAALLAGLKPRPRIHVNVHKEKTFKVVRFTTGENEGEENFDLQVIRSYVNEIFEYKRLLAYCIGDTVKSLMFWRGQVEVFSVKLPIHSMIFYCMGTTLVERPYLAPPFFILSIAWMMLATARVRTQHPSPWNRPPSFYHYLTILRTGHSDLSIDRISPKEGLEASQAYEEAWKNRLERDQEKASKLAKLRQELNDIGDEAIHTEVHDTLSLSLMKRLGRYQGYVGGFCRLLRKAKIVLTWEESIVSFWITAVCLGVGLVSLALPWAFVLTWSGRMVMWVGFGPHMMIVDLYNSGDGDLQKVVANFKQKFQIARLRREDALKLKAIKCLRFGKYITQVPAFNLARHYDRPLPQSYARVCKSKLDIQLHSMARIPEQQLYGTMIPRSEQASRRNKQNAAREVERLIALVETIRIPTKILGGIMEEPIEAGYEIIQSSDQPLCEPDSECSTSFPCDEDDSANLSLVPYVGKEKPVLSEMEDAPSVYMIVSEDPVVSQEKFPQEEEEEGIEIVACGRFNVLHEPQEDDVHDEDVDECQTLNHLGLSALFQQSENTFVGFYRPVRW